MIRRQGTLEKLDGYLIGVVGEGFQDVGLLVGHVQLFGHHGDKGALDQDGKEDDEEDNVVEVQIGDGGTGNGQNGEHDGGRPPHPRPGDQGHLTGAAAEGGHQQKDHRRPGHKSEEEGHGQGRGGDGGQLGGEREQPQQEEQEHLHEPCGPVKEVDQGFLVLQLAVAQEDAGDVYAQIAVALQQGGDDIGQQGHRHQENGVEPL